tara:strand:+ start:290 stop:481 length:192 start_codon:yes stop_codon:yes gene_type:complete
MQIFPAVFSVAIVTQAIIHKFPELARVLLGRLYGASPFCVPLYFSAKKGESDEDYRARMVCPA